MDREFPSDSLLPKLLQQLELGCAQTRTLKPNQVSHMGDPTTWVSGWTLAGSWKLEVKPRLGPMFCNIKYGQSN